MCVCVLSDVHVCVYVYVCTYVGMVWVYGCAHMVCVYGVSLYPSYAAHLKVRSMHLPVLFFARISWADFGSLKLYLVLCKYVFHDADGNGAESVDGLKKTVFLQWCRPSDVRAWDYCFPTPQTFSNSFQICTMVFRVEILKSFCSFCL